MVQGYLMAKTDEAAFRAVRVGASLAVPVWACFMLIGTCVRGYDQVSGELIPATGHYNVGQRLELHAEDKERLRAAKVFIVLTGLSNIGTALLLVQSKGSAIANGGLMGLFFLAFLTKRSQPVGVYCGIAVNLFCSACGPRWPREQLPSSTSALKTSPTMKGSPRPSRDPRATRHRDSGSSSMSTTSS